MSDEWIPVVKTHPHDPNHLASALHRQDMPDLTLEEVLADIREHPDVYFSDHVGACRDDGVLPLSEVAWRKACRAS